MAKTPKQARQLALWAADIISNKNAPGSWRISDALSTAARYVVADHHYEAVPQPPAGHTSWQDFIDAALDQALNAAERKKLFARLRMRKSRQKRQLVSLEITTGTHESLKAWQKQQDTPSLDKAIEALLAIAARSEMGQTTDH
ncbi:hypothetical protein [Paludibacterium yongneupense]|uniref:hypothetical protein n=1 Tax=Paludibacterium yongneupense TaxID=400061 RepID=UPI0012EBFFA5|nr:hypothetical protein [Paludibacterium yongneupense]